MAREYHVTRTRVNRTCLINGNNDWEIAKKEQRNGKFTAEKHGEECINGVSNLDERKY